jgi:hypothetical protein
MSAYFFCAAVIALLAFAGYKSEVKVSVYSGVPFDGALISYSRIHNNGRVYTTMKEGYNYEARYVEINYCFDSVKKWCDAMIEFSDTPVYLLVDGYGADLLLNTYYRDHYKLSGVYACQRKMQLLSSIYNY